MDTKRLFGSLIAVILLGLYVYTIGVAVCDALPKTPQSFPPNYASTLNTVGGLISALVIAVLAITPPNTAPGANLVAPNAAARTQNIVGTISTIYVLVWTVLGFVAFLYGVLLRPDVVPALTNFGQTWLGLAVSSAYAYFGLQR